MWSALAITEFVALMPVIFGSAEPQPAWMVVYRAVGGSFAACGLVAWRRRPDSRVGMLMTATGFGLFVWPVLGQVDSPTVLIVADLFEDAWGIPIITLLLGVPHRRTAQDAGATACWSARSCSSSSWSSRCTPSTSCRATSCCSPRTRTWRWR